MKKILIAGNSEIKKRIEIEKNINKKYELHNITPENFNENSFMSIFQMGSMFSNEKMVIINNFDKFKDKNREIIAETISSKNSSIDLLIVTTDKEKELKNLKIFDKKINAKLPAPWEKDKWRSFVREILERFNKKMNDGAIDYLLEVLGSNDLFIYEEIQKLSIYSDDDFISKKDVIEAATHFSKPEYEDLAYYISSQNEEKAINIITELLEDPQFIHMKLLFYFTNYFYDLYKTMTVISETKKYTWPNVKKISKEIKVSSNRLRAFCGVTFSNDSIKKINVARVLTKENAAKIIINLENLDRELKSGEDVKYSFIKFIKNSMFHKKNNP